MQPCLDAERRLSHSLNVGPDFLDALRTTADEFDPVDGAITEADVSEAGLSQGSNSKVGSSNQLFATEAGSSARSSGFHE